MKGYESAYPGSMHVQEDGEFISRHEPENLAAALIERIHELERQCEDISDLRARLEKEGWQPISTAPDDTLVVVGWLDPEDAEHPERHDLDFKEEGGWVRHADLYEHYCMVAPPESTGPKEKAPYTHWMAVPKIPRIAAIAKERTS